MKTISMLEPQNYEAWKHALLKKIAAMPEDKSFFWLVDPCAHPELPGLFWRLEAKPEAWPLYMNSYLDEVINSGPYLLSGKKNSPITRWMAEVDELFPVSSMVEVEKGREKQLFEHFQGLVECLDPQGEAALFRFHDPRIIYALGTYGNAELLSQCLGPALSLTAWEPGRAVAIALENKNCLSAPCIAPYAYSQEYIDHIWTEVHIHTLIGNLRNKLHLRDKNLHDCYMLFESGVRFALSQGYTDRYALTYAGCVTAQYGEKVWRHPDVLTAFAQRPPDAAFEDVGESIAWENLRHH